VDERGAAAIWATHLDDWFGGDPVQYRETQNHESEKFMGLFPNGVTYKKGGIASAFRSVTVNFNDNRCLYQVCV
jgi:gelsolin